MPVALLQRQRSTRLRAAAPEKLGGADEAQVSATLIAAGVPGHFAGARLDTFRPGWGTKRALELACHMPTSGSGRGLALVGPPGVGKTHLAVGILAERERDRLRRFPAVSHDVPLGDVVVRPPFLSRFVVVGQLLRQLRQRAAGDLNAGDPIEPLRDAPYLVLDDLGRERWTDFAAEVLFNLVDHRYGEELPIIVTTNFTPNELASRGYDALISRLVAHADVVALVGSDFRLERHP